MAVSINPMIPFPIPGFKRAAFAANLLHVLLAYTPFQHLPEQWRPRMKRGETVDVASSFSSVFSRVFGTLSLCLLQIFFFLIGSSSLWPYWTGAWPDSYLLEEEELLSGLSLPSLHFQPSCSAIVPSNNLQGTLLFPARPEFRFICKMRPFFRT